MSLTSSFHSVPPNQRVGCSIFKAPAIEIENAFILPGGVRSQWIKAAQEMGFRFSENEAFSVYFDTRHLDIFRNGGTLRGRRGANSIIRNASGVQLIEHAFPNQFSFKSQHPEFQTAINQIVNRLYPAIKNETIVPYVRREIEGAHQYPPDAAELRFGDLPNEKWLGHSESIADVVSQMVKSGRINGIRNLDDLVLMPIVTTLVNRRKALFYIDVKQSMFTNFRKKDRWPSPFVTEEMKKSEEFVCLEVALDKLTERRPSSSATIGSIMRATTGSDFKTFERVGKASLLEYEVKPELCGANLTDEQMVRGYIEFGQAFHIYAQSQGRGHPLRRTASKGANAISHLPECRKGGSFFDICRAALPFVA